MSSAIPSTTAFEEIVREHGDMVFRSLYRLVGSGDAVDDLAQEVFLRLFRALPRFRGDALITTYLYRIVVNVAQDHWKRRDATERRTVSMSDEVSQWGERLAHGGMNPEEALLSAEESLRAEAELQRLKPAERAVLVLYHQEELTYGQIAESLQLPIGTVRTHLHRGRARLAEAMKKG